jgi:hypothetical protein
MVLLRPVPYNIIKRIIQTKMSYNLPYDSFIYIFKVDNSEKIICFIENQKINGLAILVWKYEEDKNPWEQLVVIKLYNKPNSKYLSPLELPANILISQIDQYNFEIKGIISRNCYIYNLHVYTINEYEVIGGQLYCIKKNPVTTEMAYCISKSL